MLYVSCLISPNAAPLPRAILKESTTATRTAIRRAFGRQLQPHQQRCHDHAGRGRGDGRLLCSGAAQPANDADLHRPRQSIFTNNSTRWDMGKKIYPREYYLEYLYMGYTCRKPELLDPANAIMQMVERHALRGFDCLINLMLLPGGWPRWSTRAARPHELQILRRGRALCAAAAGSWSYTILNNSPSFLFFQHSDFTLTVRIGASFCEHRNCPRPWPPRTAACPAPDHDRLVLPALCRKPRHQRLVADGQCHTAKSSTAPTWCLTCR